MRSLIKAAALSFCAVLTFGLASGTALADAQITFGDTTLGVNDEGHLNVTDTTGVTTNAGSTGLTFDTDGDGTGEDATSPGCLCEGWGVAVNGSESITATQDNPSGVSNLTVDSFTSTASTATSVVSMISLPGLTVTHAYQPSAAANVFEATVTIENNTGGSVTDVLYTRAMDWDIAPDEFFEFVTIGGTDSANLDYSSNNGFANVDPLVDAGFTGLTDCGISVDFTDCGPQDHGAYFRFAFGDLLDGESVTFKIFYGAATSEAGATAALGTIGAELFSFGQANVDPTGGTPATYLFAFSGVGGDPVVPPTAVSEPSTLMLLGMGLLGFVGFARRRRMRR